MASSDNLPQPQVPTFVPALDVPIEAQDEFDSLQSQLDQSQDDLDLIVPATTPDPIGRTWVFDWGSRKFFTGGTGRGPLGGSGLVALQEWIRKCLMTERGAHPIHPPDYGLAPSGLPRIGGALGDVPPGLDQDIEDALLFHPWISAVSDFVFTAQGDALNVQFTVTLATGEDVTLSNVKLGVGIPQ